jgi:hypothetical protein
MKFRGKQGGYGLDLSGESPLTEGPPCRSQEDDQHQCEREEEWLKLVEDYLYSDKFGVT